MSWKITINDRNGKHVAETNANWNTVRAYLACCQNVTFEDEQAGQAALVKQLPEDDTMDEDELFDKYGVNTRRNIESAFLMLFCAIGAGLCVIIAVLIELLTK